MENQIGPKKPTLPAPEQYPLIPLDPVSPAPEPSDDDTLRRIAHENQEQLRKEREEKAEKPPHTDI